MNIALLGTGLMGQPLGARLLAAGHNLWAWNRTPGRAAGLVELGAGLARDPVEALRHAEAVVLMLADAAAIETSLLTAAARTELRDRLVVQMGTIAPAESRAIGAVVEEAGGAYLEAPVLGSIPEARDGTLLVMAGGTTAALERAAPLLRCFGANPIHVGPVGQAAALKLALNQLIGALTSGFALSLGLVQREGVPVETFMTVLRQSALYAPTFDKKLERMLTDDYANPNFPVKHLLKDLRLFAAAARAQGLDPALAELVVGVLERAQAEGLGDQDYSALSYALRGPRPGT